VFLLLGSGPKRQLYKVPPSEWKFSCGFPCHSSKAECLQSLSPTWYRTQMIFRHSMVGPFDSILNPSNHFTSQAILVNGTNRPPSRRLIGDTQRIGIIKLRSWSWNGVQASAHIWRTTICRRSTRLWTLPSHLALYVLIPPRQHINSTKALSSSRYRVTMSSASLR